MRPSENVISVEKISVSIDDKMILKAIDFQVRQGEFVGIIGPNGVGKSTLLKALRGLLPGVEGEIKILGQPIKGKGNKDFAKIVAYMQQEVNVSFGFTALEVVLAGRYPYLKWWESEGEADYAIARKYMAFTGVSDLENQSILHVSGGQRQRIFLAKILAQETPIVFLDEPTASLDLMYQEEIFRYCQILAQEGKTVLIVAHDLKMAAKFCSRLLLLSEQEMIADGIPEKVITAENLKRAYGLHAAVYINKITGLLDIHTFVGQQTHLRGKWVHVIGGGGSSSEIMRVLYERGYRITGGVLTDGDVDLEAAKAFDVQVVEGSKSSPIQVEEGEKNREWIKKADLTILSNLYYGEQNLDNLKAAFAARRLFLVEDTPLQDRDFTAGKATHLYEVLMKQDHVQVVTSKQLVENII